MGDSCDYAECSRDSSLVERQHAETGDRYQYCPHHDPLRQDNTTWQFEEVE